MIFFFPFGIEKKHNTAQLIFNAFSACHVNRGFFVDVLPQVLEVPICC